MAAKSAQQATTPLARSRRLFRSLAFACGPEPFRAWPPLLCIDSVVKGETVRSRLCQVSRQEEIMSRVFRRTVVSLLFISASIATGAHAAWQPTKPIEFVATAGPGGGTDIIARTVQSIMTKYKLTSEPTVVVNKGGGSGAEGYTYGKAAAGDPHKVIFGT